MKNEIPKDEKYESLPKVSHFDGTSSVSFTCGVCRLPADESVRKNQYMCTPCFRFQIIQKTANTFGRYSLAALLLGLTIYFIEYFAQFSFLLPFLAIIFFIPMIVSSKFVQMQIYRDLKDSQKIPHLLKYYSLLKYNENYFLDEAESLMTQDLQVNSQYRHILIYYLVEYVVLNNKPKPENLIENWAETFGIEEEELVDEMFEYTNFEDAFYFHKGVGILPEVWPYIKSDETRLNKVMEILENASKSLDEANRNERLYFLEDMYLIEQDLIEIIEKEQKWFAIDDVLVDFEPESPPQNMFQAFQAQAEESARQLEQKKNE